MLLAMAVWDNPENGRTWMTEKTLHSLARTVDWDKHRLIVCDNASCRATHDLYQATLDDRLLPFTVIYNDTNLGTARAINRAWKQREPGEHALKMDNDVTIAQPGWADWMEDVFSRDYTIGICGLKRKDLAECPWSDNDWYRSRIKMLPHAPGQRWLIVEEVLHVIGTCQAYSSLLLDQIGYLYQPGQYAFDDGLASIRSRVSGFKNVFLHGFEIDHIDPGGDDYTKWKKEYASQFMATYHQLKDQYESGKRGVYYDGGASIDE